MSSAVPSLVALGVLLGAARPHPFAAAMLQAGATVRHRRRHRQRGPAEPGPVHGPASAAHHGPGPVPGHRGRGEAPPSLLVGSGLGFMVSV